MPQVGNNRLAERHGWKDLHEEAYSSVQKWQDSGGTASFVGVDSELVAILCVNDKLRKNCKQGVEQLHDLDLATMMITGDNNGAARNMQQNCGVQSYQAEATPAQKTQAVASLKSQGHIIGFVGDGINDGPALAAAHVGMAMGASGTAVAMETADVVLMDSDLKSLAVAVGLARRAQLTIVQNVMLSVITKLIVISLAIGGYALLWLAIVTDCGTMLVVTANSMRILRFGQRKHQSAHGHSHGGQACGGHGQPQKPVQHGHSHGGQACAGHGQPQKSAHGHGGHGQPQKSAHGHGGHGHGQKQHAGHGHGQKQQDHGHSHGGKVCDSEHVSGHINLDVHSLLDDDVDENELNIL